MFRLKTLFLAAFAALTLGINPAFAVTFFSPQTGFEDDDIEFHIDSGGAPGTAGNGLIDVGERLVGVAEFNLTHSIPPGTSAPIAPQELTAVFDLTVTAVNCLPGNTICQFSFAPTGAGGELAGRPAGTAVTLWLDDTPDLDVVTENCNSLANCVALASDGNVFLDGGFYGDPDAGWTALADASLVPGGDARSTAFVAGLNATQNGGTYNFCLNVDPTTNGTGFELTPINCGGGQTQIAGGGTIKGGQGLNSGAFARSDNDFQLQTAVPEPSSMILLGVGLLGINLVVRRRRKNK
jgi:hypothetical protein